VSRLRPASRPPGGLLARAYAPSTGQLTVLSGPYDIDLAFDYDGRLVEDVAWFGPVSGSVGWSYDTDFRIATETVNGASAITFGYDLDSLLTSAGPITLTRDPQNGRVTDITSGDVVETMAYSDYGEIESSVAAYSGTPMLSFAYLRDDLGRITQKTETLLGVARVFEYAYDPAGRLIEVKEDGGVIESYGYDANGNRLSSLNASGTFAAAFDDQDRIETYGSLGFTWTLNGEVATKEDSATSDVTSYEYDALGNLTSVTLPNGDELEYLVDGLGRRVGKKRNGVLERGWLWRGQLQPVAEVDGTGAVTKRFVYAEGINVPELMVTSTATYRLIKDHLGSVRLVVDQATGAVAQELVYDAWGRVLVDTHPGFQPFGFAGGLYDPDTRLVRFGARDYDAEVGRWTARDAVRFDSGDGPNLFAYVNDDPLNLLDPRGFGSVYGDCDRCRLAAIRRYRHCLEQCPADGACYRACGDAKERETQWCDDHPCKKKPKDDPPRRCSTDGPGPLEGDE